MQLHPAIPARFTQTLRLEPYLHTHLPAFSNAQNSWTERRGFLLHLVAPAGHSGVGELAPLPGFSPETLEQDLHALEAWCSAAVLETLVTPVPSGQQTTNILEELLAPLIQQGTPALAFALETAWVSLQAHRSSLPPVRWLAQQLDRPIRAEVPLSRVIDAQVPEEALARLEGGVGQGIRHFKLKVGRAGQAEQERMLLRTLLRALPPTGRLRLDANGQLPPSAVVTLLETWRHDACSLGRSEALEAIEEPVSAHTLETLPKLAIPVWLDESLANPAMSALCTRLLASGKASGLVLKPGMLGGVGACLRWEGLAGRFGAVSSASHCLEGPVGHEAACWLALLLDAPLASGLDVHAHLRRWPERPVAGLTSSHVYAPA